MQFHILFKMKVMKAKTNPGATKELLRVRHYCSSSDAERERDMSLRHHEREETISDRGRNIQRHGWNAGVFCKGSASAHSSVTGTKASSNTSW